METINGNACERDSPLAQDPSREFELSQLLLLALVGMAKCSEPSPLLLQMHLRKLAGRLNGGLPLEGSDAEVFRARVALENLLNTWARPLEPLRPLAEVRNPRFTPALLLSHALSSGNVVCASLLLEARNRWDESLGLQLEEAVSVAERLREHSSGQEQEHEELVSAVLLRLVMTHPLNRRALTAPSSKHARPLMKRILEAWQALRLPAGALEEFCLPYIRLERPDCKWEGHMLSDLFVGLAVLQTWEGQLQGAGRNPACSNRRRCMAIGASLRRMSDPDDVFPQARYRSRLTSTSP
jgi:hypothetical protein